MSSIFEAVVAGLRRRLAYLKGGAKETDVAPWIGTPPYDPIKGEVIVGMDGPERVQLAADGKVYPPLCSGGYPPEKQFLEQPDNAVTLTEVTGATVLGEAGRRYEYTIVKPAAATLAIGANTCPATANDLVIPLRTYGVVTVTGGVASSWAFGWRLTNTPSTVTSR